MSEVELSAGVGRVRGHRWRGPGRVMVHGLAMDGRQWRKVIAGSCPATAA